MRQPPSEKRLRHMLLGSLAAHGLGLLLLLGWAQLSARRTPPPQNVLVTKLVRLGTPRPKELLPQKEPPPQPAPAPAAAPKPSAPAPAPTPPAAAAKAVSVAPPAPVAPSAKERAHALSRVNSALAKLKRNVDGQADGSEHGDTDIARQGDKWASEIENCIAKNYTIEGTDPRRAVGLSAVVTLHVQNNGKILDHRIQVSSGLPAFDRAVSRAVTRCNQVSPPPVAMRRQLQRDGVEITFKP
ncbi:hypothetical protein Q3G72_029189 [Acer saccharum]|nr:hypothetical protein Q3G72_029189 [Acer saccharum]